MTEVPGVEAWVTIFLLPSCLGDSYIFSSIPLTSHFEINNRQAGTELGQAQLKLKLDFNLIFCRFGLIELTGW